ncbi:uncharacterized protein LOC105847354 isoform X1 [Hydra vulgaris]|uniref:uncharacterized protein LOC105847354 isoform X1 n=1 Tax=Hydra vulgaris TaxID=6087 RepID=UPI00019273A8|nr:uncharacterized protein LOC105847354 [Hydra vulgaris]
MGNIPSITLQSNINLVKTAQAEYDFLRLVDKYPALYCKNVLKNALYRYENYWLPLLAKYDQAVIAPLDIEWVWHLHILNPAAYNKDCKKLVNKVIDHVPMFLALDTHSISLKYWSEEYPNVDYQVDLSDINPLLISTEPFKCSYDIVSAAQRHKIFSYNVLFPHFRDVNFLENAVKRYFIMLSIKRDHRQTVVVPCYDNDLVWHGHQQHVLYYNVDMKSILGEPLNHDDTGFDRSEGTQLQNKMNETKELWQKYSSNYTINGGMYRGEPLIPNLNIEKYYYSRLILKRWGSSFHFKSFSINGVSLIGVLDVINLDVVVKITVKNNANKVAEFCKKYTTSNGALQVVHTLGEASFYLISDLVYDVDIVCNYPSISKEFSGKITHLRWDKMYYIIDLKCQSNKESITFKVSSFLNNYERFEENIFYTKGNYKVFQSQLKDAINSFPMLFPSLDFHTFSNLKCEYTKNFLKADDSNRLTWKVIHSKDPPLSVIEIRDNFGKIIATSHSVDSSSLPTKKQVSNLYKSFTLDPRFERAMLIRGTMKDWGLIKACWKGFKYSKSVVNAKRGKLDVQLFMLNGVESTFVNVKSCELGLEFIINNSITVNLSSGFISLSKDLKDVPQCLCVGISIAVLFVLCQPRPAPQNGIYNDSPSSLNLNSMYILRGAGLYSNLLPRSYHRIYRDKKFYQDLNMELITNTNFATEWV